MRSLQAVLLSALAVTLLNPHVYLDTVLLIGSLGAQQSVPGAYVVGAASASLLWFFTLAFGAAWLAPWLASPKHLADPRPARGDDDVYRGGAIDRERLIIPNRSGTSIPHSCCVVMPHPRCYDPTPAPQRVQTPRR